MCCCYCKTVLLPSLSARDGTTHIEHYNQTRTMSLSKFHPLASNQYHDTSIMIPILAVPPSNAHYNLTITPNLLKSLLTSGVDTQWYPKRHSYLKTHNFDIFLISVTNWSKTLWNSMYFEMDWRKQKIPQRHKTLTYFSFQLQIDPKH